jgi:probable rRNA maturation factor
VRLRLDVAGGGACGADVDYGALSNLLGVFADRFSLPCSELSVSLSFVSPEDIKGLNARFRGLDEETDVLSFPLWEEEGRFSPPAWDDLPLGDVVVSPVYISRSAGMGNMDYNSEIILVIVHGVLHLLGFDHDTEERRRGMWREQEALVREYLTMTGAAGRTVVYEED